MNDIIKGLGISEKVYEKIRCTAKVGMTEKELFEDVEQLLRKKGFQEEDYLFDFLSGSRTAGIDGQATDKVLKNGDLLLVDFSLRCQGAWCDTCRTFFLGEPKPKQAEVYELLLKAMQAGQKAIQVGKQSEEIYQTATEVLKEENLFEKMPHHLGHGIGEKPFQAPVFNKEEQSVLKENEIVTLEPGIYFSGEWGIRMENDFLVTKEGAKSLFSYPLEMDYFILK